MIRAITLLLTMASTVITSAQCNQGMDITFQLALSGLGDERAHGVKQLSNGDYFVAGETSSFGAGSTDFFLAKISSTGVLLWSKTYGATNAENGNSIVMEVTQDGGVLIGGHTTSFGAQGAWDGLLFKVDSIGTLEWSYQFPGFGHEHIRGISALAGGDYLITGNSATGGLGVLDRWAAKITSSGALIWSYGYGTSYNDQGTGHCALPGSDLILSGAVSKNGTNGGNVNVGCLTRIDSSGAYEWNFIYPSNSATNRITLLAVTPTIDGQLVTSGYVQGYGAGGNDILVMKIDTSGQVIWARTYGTVGDERGTQILALPDGSFRVAGMSTGLGPTDKIYQLFLDPNGVIEELYAYGGSGHDRSDPWAHSLRMTADSGSVLVGSTESFGGAGEDIYMIKTNRCGDSYCFEHPEFFISGIAPIVEEAYPLSTTSVVNPVTPAMITDTALFNVLTLCSDTGITTGIEVLDVKPNPRVYPNPGADQLFVDGDSDSSFTIRDELGRIVQSGKLAGSQPLDITNLAAGIYLISVETNPDRYTARFVKK